jgi:hypothetical protein
MLVKIVDHQKAFICQYNCPFSWSENVDFNMGIKTYDYKFIDIVIPE